MYGHATQTSITLVSKFPRKTWGAAHMQQWIPGAPLPFFERLGMRLAGAGHYYLWISD